MERMTISTQPIEGQKPGTSGLRKKTRVFMAPHYLENFIQSVWIGIGGVTGKTALPPMSASRSPNSIRRCANSSACRTTSTAFS